MSRKSLLHAPTSLGAALLATVTALACGSFKGSDATGTPDPGAGVDAGSLDGTTPGSDGEVTGAAKDASGTDAGAPFICKVDPSRRVCDGFDKMTDIDPMWAVIGNTSVSTEKHVSPEHSLRTAASSITAFPGTIAVDVTAPQGHYTIDLDYWYSAGDTCKLVSLTESLTEIAALTIHEKGGGYDVSLLGAMPQTPKGDVTPSDAWVHVHLDFTFGGGPGTAKVGSLGVVLPMTSVNANVNPTVTVGSVNGGLVDCAFYLDNVDIRFE